MDIWSSKWKKRLNVQFVIVCIQMFKLTNKKKTMGQNVRHFYGKQICVISSFTRYLFYFIYVSFIPILETYKDIKNNL